MTHPADDKTRRLLEFLGEHDADCPLCGYNLRALTEPRCPECRQDLVLTVGLREMPVLWLMVTVAPCIFSGIAALLLAVPIVVATVTGGVPWVIVATDAFGFASGAAGLVLVAQRRAFMRLGAGRQRLWALAAWAVHVGAFVALLTLVP